MKVGRFADRSPEEGAAAAAEEEKVEAEAIQVGSRCEVSLKGTTRRGVVKYVGECWETVYKEKEMGSLEGGL